MSGSSSRDQRSRALLEELIARVHGGRGISDLVAPNADVSDIVSKLQSATGDDAAIESIAGNEKRVDALVTTGDRHSRVVFAHDARGRLAWLDVYLRPDRFDGNPGGRIIVVNGPSGAGKSTLMLAVQSMATFPLVVLDEPEQIGTVQPGYLIWRDRAPSLHRG